MAKMLVIGYGNMGKALVSRWLADKIIKASDLLVVNPSRPKNLPKGTKYFSDITAIKNPPDVVLLAVKPQQIPQVLSDLKILGSSSLYISIAAGIKIEKIQNMLGASSPIIRAMPNTPAKIGFGITALFANKNISSLQKQFAENLFSAAGEVLWLKNEELMNAVTAVSGSGPAYQFYFMECLVDAAINLGLSKTQAKELVLSTCRGACELALNNAEDLRNLREQVTSKGGTTESALLVFQGCDSFKNIVKEATMAALKRSKLIG